MKTEAKLFKALADETRLKILVLLLESELCVCEIIAALDLPQSTVSRHLAYLKNAGLVLDRRQGVWMYYRLQRGADRLGDAVANLLERFLADDDAIRQAAERLQTFRCATVQSGA